MRKAAFKILSQFWRVLLTGKHAQVLHDPAGVITPSNRTALTKPLFLSSAAVGSRGSNYLVLSKAIGAPIACEKGQ